MAAAVAIRRRARLGGPGSDGLDELTTTGPAYVAEFHEGQLREFGLTRRGSGLPRATAEWAEGRRRGVQCSGYGAPCRGERGARSAMSCSHRRAVSFSPGRRRQGAKQGVTIAVELIDSEGAPRAGAHGPAATRRRRPTPVSDVLEKITADKRAEVCARRLARPDALGPAPHARMAPPPRGFPRGDRRSRACRPASAPSRQIKKASPSAG